MKKIALLFVSMFIGSSVIFAQTGQSAESLLKAIAKSDAEILDVKKNTKSATWEKRGDLFLEVAQFNTKGLYQGMPQTGLTGAELLVGKPKDIKADGANEEWIYDRVNLHFENGVLQSWEETQPIDPEALNKAFEAYNKANELDDKGKFKNKNSVKMSIAILRGLVTSKGVELYSNKEYSDAVKHLEKALVLAEYPRADADTSFKVGLVTYYAGLIAYGGKDFKTAEKYYQECVDKGYEEGTPYSALASLYKETGEGTKEYDILQKGFEKFPQSKDLLVGFINYYLTSGQSGKAMEKLEQAIKDDPSNPTFQFAMATLYDTMAKDTTDKYSDSDKKAYLDKAIAGYLKSIELNADYFDANYNLGAVYYNEAVFTLKKADKLDIKQVKEFETLVEKSKEQMQSALPYLEKAHELESTDRSTIQTLLTIYHRLQKYDKKKEMQEKLDNLPAQSEGL